MSAAGEGVDYREETTLWVVLSISGEWKHTRFCEQWVLFTDAEVTDFIFLTMKHLRDKLDEYHRKTNDN